MLTNGYNIYLIPYNLTVRTALFSSVDQQQSSWHCPSPLQQCFLELAMNLTETIQSEGGAGAESMEKKGEEADDTTIRNARDRQQSACGSKQLPPHARIFVTVDE